MASWVYKKRGIRKRDRSNGIASRAKCRVLKSPHQWFSWLKWHYAKCRFTSPIREVTGYVSVTAEANEGSVDGFPADTPAYERLARFWNDLGRTYTPQYAWLLPRLERRTGQPIGRVLDLACGTGLESRALARSGKSVVGIDRSPAMLADARRRSKDFAIEYIEADVRTFSIGRTFDAAICGGDSLNHLESPGELRVVFANVARHLEPGGFFLFDALDHDCFCMSALFNHVVEVAGERLTLMHFYNPEMRVGEVRLVFADAIERHRRVPIEPTDVDHAASDSDLAVIERFSARTYSLFKNWPTRTFYILRKRAFGAG